MTEHNQQPNERAAHRSAERRDYQPVWRCEECGIVTDDHPDRCPECGNDSFRAIEHWIE